jgi:hypothetical protein
VLFTDRFECEAVWHASSSRPLSRHSKLQIGKQMTSQLKGPCLAIQTSLADCVGAGRLRDVGVVMVWRMWMGLTRMVWATGTDHLWCLGS